MKKGESSINRNGKTFEKRLGFPLEIPICVNNKNLVTVKINIDINRKETNTTEIVYQCYIAVIELRSSINNLKEGMELVEKLI